MGSSIYDVTHILIFSNDMILFTNAMYGIVDHNVVTKILCLLALVLNRGAAEHLGAGKDSMGPVSL